MIVADWKTSASQDLVPGIAANKAVRGPDGWKTTEADAKGVAFDLLFAEFDDQGRPFTPDIAGRIIAHIETVASEQDPLIIVFVHGWKHSARDDDENVESFRRLLHANAHIETLRPTGAKPRRVVGLYVGWRGLTFHWLNLIQNITFWGRKEAALRVALGSVRELFARLRAFRLRDEAGPEGAGARLVFVGHSFGGLIVYSAMAEFLMGSLVASDDEHMPVLPFGDLTILVNPAFEAARYYPVHWLVANRGFAVGQAPVFVSVTASNDWATGWAFPIGRFFGLYKGPSAGARERSANYNTMGHIPWMKTHELSLAPERASYASPKLTATEPLDDAQRKVQLDAEDAAYAQFRSRETDGDGHLLSGWSRVYSSGAALRQAQPVPGASEKGIAPDNPFWVAEASPDIVDGHNGIFKAVFLDFLRQVFDDTIRASKPGQKR